MEPAAPKTKKKRSELELLISLDPPPSRILVSPTAPCCSLLSISVPTAPASAAVAAQGPTSPCETDEELARRLHEELNGMRSLTRRGSRAIPHEELVSPRPLASPSGRARPAAVPPASVAPAPAAPAKAGAALPEPGPASVAAAADAAHCAQAPTPRPPGNAPTEAEPAKRKASGMLRELQMLLGSNPAAKAPLPNEQGPAIRPPRQQQQPATAPAAVPGRQPPKLGIYAHGRATGPGFDGSRPLSPSAHAAAAVASERFELRPSGGGGEQAPSAGSGPSACKGDGDSTTPTCVLDMPHVACSSSASEGECTLPVVIAGPRGQRLSQRGDAQRTVDGPQPLAPPAGQAACAATSSVDKAVPPAGHQLQELGSAAAGGASAYPHLGKVPKLPMVLLGRIWYRARVMQDKGGRVLLEYPGFGHMTPPFWLPKESERIWRGSYKGRDWKHLGAGAWEPKPCAFKRGKLGSTKNGLPLPPRSGRRVGGRAAQRAAGSSSVGMPGADIDSSEDEDGEDASAGEEEGEEGLDPFEQQAQAEEQEEAERHPSRQNSMRRMSSGGVESLVRKTQRLPRTKSGHNGAGGRGALAFARTSIAGTQPAHADAVHHHHHDGNGDPRTRRVRVGPGLRFGASATMTVAAAAAVKDEAADGREGSSAPWHAAGQPTGRSRRPLAPKRHSVDEVHGDEPIPGLDLPVVAVLAPRPAKRRTLERMDTQSDGEFCMKEERAPSLPSLSGTPANGDAARRADAQQQDAAAVAEQQQEGLACQRQGRSSRRKGVPMRARMEGESLSPCRQRRRHQEECRIPEILRAQYDDCWPAANGQGKRSGNNSSRLDCAASPWSSAGWHDAAHTTAVKDGQEMDEEAAAAAYVMQALSTGSAPLACRSNGPARRQHSLSADKADCLSGLLEAVETLAAAPGAISSGGSGGGQEHGPTDSGQTPGGAAPAQSAGQLAPSSSSGASVEGVVTLQPAHSTPRARRAAPAGEVKLPALSQSASLQLQLARAVAAVAAAANAAPSQLAPPHALALAQAPFVTAASGPSRQASLEVSWRTSNGAGSSGAASALPLLSLARVVTTSVTRSGGSQRQHQPLLDAVADLAHDSSPSMQQLQCRARHELGDLLGLRAEGCEAAVGCQGVDQGNQQQLLLQPKRREGVGAGAPPPGQKPAAAMDSFLALLPTMDAVQKLRKQAPATQLCAPAASQHSDSAQGLQLFK